MWHILGDAALIEGGLVGRHQAPCKVATEFAYQGTATATCQVPPVYKQTELDIYALLRNLRIGS